MIFRETWQQVLDGTKTQTRRPVKPGDFAVVDEDGTILEVRDIHGRLKWAIGKDYAAQPGRGKKAMGRTPPIEKIRRERLQEITPHAAKAEGVKNWYYHHGAIMDRTYIEAFVGLWNSLYRRPYRWRDNPEVWVLEFEKADNAS